MNNNSIRSTRITVRLNDSEKNKLEELAKKSIMGNADLIRNLIMTADSISKDPLSIELLQRIYMVLQILVETMKVLVPGKITQEWMDKIVDNSKKRYPID